MNRTIMLLVAAMLTLSTATLTASNLEDTVKVPDINDLLSNSYIYSIL
mgnify:CR=1 FL=1